MSQLWQLETYGGPEHLRSAEREAPVAGAGEVLIRVEAVSLNYRDLLHLKSSGSGNLPLPFVPCSDGAGVVEAVGSGVTRWKTGDRVAGIFFRDWVEGPFELSYHKAALGGSAPGMLAEHVVLPEHSLVPVPEHLSLAEAACLPCAGVTAWQALFRRGDLKAGETVLALGTGGVSIFALQLAVAAGARVIITSSSDAKLERARAMGASEGVNYRSSPEWDKEVWRLSGKRGVDHVMEVGGPGTLGRSMACVAADGKIALIGVLTGFAAPDASLFPIVGRNARIDGIYVGSRADFEALNAFLTRHQLKPVVDQVFPWADAPAAFTHMQSGAHFGKVVIQR